jgi:salicylate hydroxylase
VRSPVRDTDIAIAGAGIGGLCAALALQQRGFRPVVYEQAQELREVGAGITLSPNATRVLVRLGLGPALAPRACVPAWQAIRHYATGLDLVRTERGARTEAAYGAPYWMLHRADLQAALVAAVRANDASCLRSGHVVGQVEAVAGGVKLRFAGGGEVRCAVLVGADGIKSTVRGALHGSPPPEFTGFIAFRGLVPAAALPAALRETPSAVYIGPQRMFARYDVRAGELVNFAAYARRADWRIESWSARAEPADVLADFTDFHADCRAILAATPPDACFRWAMFDRAPLEGWTAGRATLLGDAAHPMLPFLGQGAAMAIEDALVLARCLEADADPDAALRRYEAARVPRSAFVQAQSTAIIRRYQGPDPSDYGPANHVNEETLGLFGYDAGTVPI